MYDLEYVGLWGLPPGDLDMVCYFPVALLEPCRIARVDPENPCFGRSLLGPVRIFDGELRLASQQLAIVSQARVYLPNAAQADERSPRTWHGTFTMDLI
jgi:hypothetical protein